jgi:hypothetical protein
VTAAAARHLLRSQGRRYEKPVSTDTGPWLASSCSDSDTLAALTAARGQDGTASPGAHPLAEAMDLRPPTVIRLERALAHWSSRCGSKLVQIREEHAGRRAARPGRIHPQAAAAAVTWLSLLTVRAIGSQVKPDGERRAPPAAKNRPRPAYSRLHRRSAIVEHDDFHNVPVPGDLGCGKIKSAGRTAELAGTTDAGKPRYSAYTACGRACGQPVAVGDRDSGKTRRERIIERR